MDCEQFLYSYSDFLDRKLERHDLADYCSHILSCPSCAEYDGVMRRGLHLVRQLDPPRPESDFASRVQRGVMAGLRGAAPTARRSVSAALGVAAVALTLVATSLIYTRSTDPLALPPLVVEATQPERTRPSLFGPAPRLRPEASLFPTSTLTEGDLFVFPSEPLSLFRTPLRPMSETRAISDSRPVVPH